MSNSAHPINLWDRYSPTVGTSTTGLYIMSKEQIRTFKKEIAEKNLTETVTYWIAGDPLESVLGIKFFFGMRQAVQPTQYPSHVCLGKVIFNGNGWNSQESIVAYPLANEWMQYSFGQVGITQKYKNYLDLAPYTTIQLFLPFIGFVTLDPSEFMASVSADQVRVDYKVNARTGSGVALIYTTKLTQGSGSTGPRLAMEVPFDMGVEEPMNLDASLSIASKVALTTIGGSLMVAGGLGAASKALPMATSASSPVTAGVVAGSMASQVTGAAQEAGERILTTNNMLGTEHVRSGGHNEVTGIMSGLRPFLLISRPVDLAPSDYESFVGTPTFRVVRPRLHKGYMKANLIKPPKPVGTTNPITWKVPSRPIFEEIQNLLKAGVYYE